MGSWQLAWPEACGQPLAGSPVRPPSLLSSLAPVRNIHSRDPSTVFSEVPFLTALFSPGRWQY